MEHSFPAYLCLTDLLDQDLSAYEYFQTLSPAAQRALREDSGEIVTFAELQAQARRLRDAGRPEW